MAEEAVWQDREIRFDAKVNQLAPRTGETVMDSINSIEDTKGNNGERGSMRVTNLRLIWVSHKRTRTNLSIGFNTVVSVAIKKARSKLRGGTQALYLMTKTGGSRYEFIFTSLVHNSPRLFTTVQAVLRAYETSRLYRDLKLRVSIVKDGRLQHLPDEKLFSKLEGVWNLSSDQGNLGTMFLTNVRVVWHATLAHNFNVSIPHIQIASLKVRASKFGPALVVETTQASGGYVLGFRIDPADRLNATLQEVQSLHAVYAKAPNFGVQFATENPAPAVPTPIPNTHLDGRGGDDDDDDDPHASYDPVAAYYADKPTDAAITFDRHLGLAIETLPDHIDTSSLWAIAV